LDRRHGELLRERERAFAVDVDEDSRKQREAYRKNQADYDRDEQAFNARNSRYFALLGKLKDLRGIRVVATTLLWTDGHPAQSDTALSRYFDERPFRAALWFAPAGEDTYQSWIGLFRDSDGNGVMEFADAKKRLPTGSWSAELNFLG